MSLLPGQIQPQSVPFGTVDAQGRVFVDQNWYLFLYNLANQILSGQASGSVPTSQADIIDMVDLDATTTPFEPQAPHMQSVTVGASPFVFRALANGVLSISGGAVSAVSLARQGAAVSPVLTSGMVRLRRLDEVTITYGSTLPGGVATPTVMFLPD